MHHFEGFTQAKNPDAPHTNEDRLVVVPERIYAVIDGATDLGGLRYDDRLGQGATGGHLAAQAIAEALTQAANRPYTDLPEPQELAGVLNDAIAATYRRIGIAQTDITSGRSRFRASLAAALIGRGQVRLIALGDCAIRINGKIVLEHHFPGDLVLSRARSIAWSILAAKGLDAATIRAVARQLIVVGTASDAVLPEPLTEEDRALVVDQVRHDAALLEACEQDRSLIDELLEAGLEGIRADPQRFNAMVLDGVSDVRAAIRSLDVPIAEIETLELVSDGYPSHPAETSIAAWERALADADRVDPDRIGPHASTKGRIGKHFGDDRSILIVTAGQHQ